MTSTITSVREQVERAAGRYATQYPRIVTGVTEAIASTGNVQDGKDYLARQGYGSYGYLLDGITLGTVPEAGETTADEVVETSGFDRATAAEVIRSFVQSDHPHNGSIGYEPAEVDALLILAGLEDEPEPEPEVVDETVDPSLFRRLVEFARGHGFRG